MSLKEDLTNLLNRNCAESASNTPDYVLAEYLCACLKAFECAARSRENWYGMELTPGMSCADRIEQASHGHPVGIEAAGRIRLFESSDRSLDAALRSGIPVCYCSGGCQGNVLHYNRPKEVPSAVGYTSFTRSKETPPQGVNYYPDDYPESNLDYCGCGGGCQGNVRHFHLTSEKLTSEGHTGHPWQGL